MARLLRETRRYLAVDKAPGELVIPGRAEDEPEALRDSLARELGQRLWVVHRLDVGTSGVLLFARDADAHRSLSRAFEGREVEKHYLALVEGSPSFEERVVDVPLREVRRGRMRPARPSEEGKPSRTDLRVVERLQGHALVEAIPRTGRHHQVRVHLRAAGHPLAFDPMYGRKEPLRAGDALLARTPLHASRLRFPDPDGGATVEVEAPLPADIAAVVEALRAGA